MAGALLVGLAGCAAAGGPQAPSAPRLPSALSISFEDVVAPAVYRFEGPAVVDAADGAAGLWAAVPALPRPERGLLFSPATGAAVEVALFATPEGGRAQLSAEAGRALGLGAEETATVVITALRREPAITAAYTDF